MGEETQLQKTERLKRQLKGATLHYKEYTRHSESWDHDHCLVCWAKFMESGGVDILNEGYATDDDRDWVCASCFHDLKSAMGW